MYPQTNAVPMMPPPSVDTRGTEEPMLAAQLNIIRSARQRVETIASRSGNLADRIFGAQPTGVAGSANKAAETNSVKASLEVELRELHNAIDWLDSQVQRVERVA